MTDAEDELDGGQKQPASQGRDAHHPRRITSSSSGGKRGEEQQQQRQQQQGGHAAKKRKPKQQQQQQQQQGVGGAPPGALHGGGSGGEHDPSSLEAGAAATAGIAFFHSAALPLMQHGHCSLATLSAPLPPTHLGGAFGVRSEGGISSLAADASFGAAVLAAQQPCAAGQPLPVLVTGGHSIDGRAPHMDVTALLGPAPAQQQQQQQQQARSWQPPGQRTAASDALGMGAAAVLPPQRPKAATSAPPLASPPPPPVGVVRIKQEHDESHAIKQEHDEGEGGGAGGGQDAAEHGWLALGHAASPLRQLRHASCAMPYFTPAVASSLGSPPRVSTVRGSSRDAAAPGGALAAAPGAMQHGGHRWQPLRAAGACR